jgi:hypothetical protein
MNVGGIVCLDDHITAVIANPDHKLVDHKTRRHFVVFVEDLQYAVMRGFISFADAAGRSRQEMTYFMNSLL